MQKKDFDMQVMEERYKKYIEKAKSVIKTLDPKTAAAAAGTAAGSAIAGQEMGQLRTQLNEKEQRIETMEHVSEDNALRFAHFRQMIVGASNVMLLI